MNDRQTANSWLKYYFKKFFWYVAGLSLLGTVGSIFAVGFAIATQRLVDVASGQKVGNLIHEMIIMSSLVLIQVILQISNSRLYAVANVSILAKMKSDIFSRIFSVKYDEIVSYHSAELMNRITSDTSVVSSGIVDIIPIIISLGVRIGLSFILLSKIDFSYAVVCIILIPLLTFIAHAFRKKIQFLHKQVLESDGKAKSFMQECIQNVLIVKAFNNLSGIMNIANKLLNINKEKTVKKNDVAIVANIMFYLTITASYYITLMWGAYRMSQGIITFGSLIAMLELIGQIENPVRTISGLYPQYYSVVASAQRITEIINLDCEDIVDQNTDVEISELHIDNLSYAYPNKKIFDNAELIIKKGTLTGVSGDSGIGKSTLIKLLLGIIEPQHGSIYAIDKSGNKIAINASTRGLFSYVPQGNLILSGTIKENITFGKDTFDEELFNNVLSMSELDEVINKLPNGVETQLAERGHGLSEGQLQRIGIARALYNNNQIIIFDEATASLDANTAKIILENIKKNRKMGLIISHNYDIIHMCNNIVEVKCKKIVLK